MDLMKTEARYFNVWDDIYILNSPKLCIPPGFYTFVWSEYSDNCQHRSPNGEDVVIVSDSDGQYKVPRGLFSDIECMESDMKRNFLIKSIINNFYWTFASKEVFDKFNDKQDNINSETPLIDKLIANMRVERYEWRLIFNENDLNELYNTAIERYGVEYTR